MYSLVFHPSSLYRFKGKNQACKVKRGLKVANIFSPFVIHTHISERVELIARGGWREYVYIRVHITTFQQLSHAYMPTCLRTIKIRIKPKAGSKKYTTRKRLKRICLIYFIDYFSLSLTPFFTLFNPIFCLFSLFGYTAVDVVKKNLPFLHFEDVLYCLYIIVIINACCSQLTCVCELKLSYT